MSDELRRIERDIRGWTVRPPAIPPRVARTRVLARIEERRRWAGWRLAAAATVGVVGLASWLLVFGPKEPSSPPAIALAEQPSQRILVYELESGTKLYLALAATAVQAPTLKENAAREGGGQ